MVLGIQRVIYVSYVGRENHLIPVQLQRKSWDMNLKEIENDHVNVSITN